MRHYPVISQSPFFSFLFGFRAHHALSLRTLHPFAVVSRELDRDRHRTSSNLVPVRFLVMPTITIRHFRSSDATTHHIKLGYNRSARCCTAGCPLGSLFVSPRYFFRGQDVSRFNCAELNYSVIDSGVAGLLAMYTDAAHFHIALYQTAIVRIK
ncbi:hypothetical protein B0H12DRAFT_531044 [Mycena haematopus]|nr:hypothetical protein B0H12DRAFT_531044 [Mycena haematopus]